MYPSLDITMFLFVIMSCAVRDCWVGTGESVPTFPCPPVQSVTVGWHSTGGILGWAPGSGTSDTQRTHKGPGSPEQGWPRVPCPGHTDPTPSPAPPCPGLQRGARKRAALSCQHSPVAALGRRWVCCRVWSRRSVGEGLRSHRDRHGSRGATLGGHEGPQPRTSRSPWGSLTKRRFRDRICVIKNFKTGH